MKLKLSTKLLGGFLIVAIITLGVGYLGWNGATQLTGHLNTLGKHSLPSVQNLLTIQKNIESVLTAQNALLNPSLNSGMRKQQFDRIAQARDIYQKAWNAYDALPKYGESAKLWDQTKRAVEVWREENNKFFTLAKSLDKVDSAKGDIFTAMNKQLMEKCLPRQAEGSALMDKIVALSVEDAGQTLTQAEAGASRTKFLSGVGMVAGFGLAVLLGVFLSLSITRPINRIIAELNEGADQVSSASSQVSSASQILAQGNSEQAASLEETSSSLEEMASMTKQNAGHASEANALMQETGRVVQEADRYMQDLTSSMQEISQASSDTAKIIKTIDEIAFQTNLLALNAAVEAARAGEAGAGFAVVADEVRNLAMRAAEAAKNTAQLIEGTLDKVQGGTDLVGKTGEAFAQVTTSASKVKDLVAEIDATSREQSQGADQISKAVAEMDSVVQQNAANAEESASAAEELFAQAEQMKGVVGGLVSLVSGTNGNSQSSPVTRSLQGSYGSRPALSHSRNAGKSRAQALPQPQGHGPAQSLNPEQVIPLEPKDFQDF
ncbi:MAG: methyl-accepting chemotaxis protein [Syntrophales bacterium]|nr:methyl-accepting chemotaxis protein [Syntrophales bacterium]